MWLPLLVRDIAGIDRSNFLDSVISDDLIDDVGQIFSRLRDGRGMDGEPLPYRDEATERIDQALRTAQSRCDEQHAGGKWNHADPRA
jgi:hypothetical protein